MARDLYSVLGVSKDADEDTIKKAFRKLAMKYHPDKNPGKANEAKFKEINSANEVLSDKARRATYDEFGEASLASGFDAERARAMRDFGARAGRGPSVRHGRPGEGGDVQEIFGGDIGDLLGDFFGRVRGGAGAGPARRPVQKTRGSDVESSVTIDFLAAVKGTSLELQKTDGASVTVRIPPGAQEGSRIRIPGQGGPGGAGGAPGDLVLLIHVTPHALLKREGDDLHLEVPVTVGEAYNGAKIRIPTPDGEVSLKVPARTQTGNITRLRGKGIARRGRDPGDLYVRFLVQIPISDAAEVVEAIAVLERNAPAVRDQLKL